MRNYQSIDENNEAYVTTLALGKKYVAVVQLYLMQPTGFIFAPFT